MTRETRLATAVLASGFRSLGFASLVRFFLSKLEGKPSCFGIEKLGIREKGVLKESRGLGGSFRVNVEATGFGIKWT